MPLGMEVGLGPDDIVLDGDPDPPSQKGCGAPCPIFGPCLLWSKGLMDQDATWYGARPWPRRLCVRWRPSYPQKKGHTHSDPIFGPCLMWPNGWMDQGATWYAGKPWPRRRCVRSGRSSSLKEAQPPQFSVHVYCAETAGWMKTPLGTEVDLGPGNIVLDGVPALRKRGTAASLFSAHVYYVHGRPSQLLVSSCLCLLWPPYEIGGPFYFCPVVTIFLSIFFFLA